MDSSDEDTFDESNATEDEEEIDEIFEEDEIDDDDNQSSMSLDQDEQNAADTVADHFMEDNWPPQNIPLTVTDKSNKKKPGIIFLSSIPPGFNVTTTITFFSQFGKVGRVFLQPDMKEKAKRKDKLARHFTEGWIEFLSKRAAKEVASNLNNTLVGGKKRSKAHDVLWNIKYLPKFKWTNLSERLAYEKAVHHQRLRTEISQAKREADFLRPTWKNQSEWVEKGLENRPNRPIQPKGCTISAKGKPIHPSEKANSKKIHQITAAAKKQTSLLQLLSEYHGKFILLENKIMIIWFFLLSH
jgi:ESF2/ABP1 family protein